MSYHLYDSPEWLEVKVNDLKAENEKLKERIVKLEEYSEELKDERDDFEASYYYLYDRNEAHFNKIAELKEEVENLKIGVKICDLETLNRLHKSINEAAEGKLQSQGDFTCFLHEGEDN